MKSIVLPESLNVDAVDRAIELLRQAKRVEFYAMGNSAVVALDAQHKLFRFRIPSVAHTDVSMLTMASELLGPEDVAVFVSSSGQPPELARAAGIAVERGASVISVTSGQSPLARRSTVCIPVEHNEDVTSFVSMISRILHLLVVDMLSVGLAVRRAGVSGLGTPASAPGQPSAAEGQVLPVPGVLISHIAWHCIGCFPRLEQGVAPACVRQCPGRAVFVGFRDDQTGAIHQLADHKGRKLLIYFYPRADTPGCTTQSCSVRDARRDLGKHHVDVVGISPDKPAAQQKFDSKYGLGFPLLADESHAVAEAFGVWGEKSMYGRKYMGIVRSAFLIDERGKIVEAWYGVSPKDTVPGALAVLAG